MFHRKYFKIQYAQIIIIIIIIIGGYLPYKENPDLCILYYVDYNTLNTAKLMNMFVIRLNIDD